MLLNQLPGLDSLPDSVEIESRNLPCANTPEINTNHIFDVDSIRVLMFALTDESSDGLLIYGPPGCGKSSELRQLRAFTNTPLFTIHCNAEMVYEDFIGTKEIVGGDTVTSPGPLVLAAQMGVPILFEEFDRLQASTQTSLTSILDGYPVKDTLRAGLEIPLNKGFKIFATANTNGNGDLSGDFNTATVVDKSTLDRFYIHERGYPTEDKEILILRNYFPEVESELLLATIKFANSIRKLYLGETPDKVVDSDAEQVSMETTFTMRSLIRYWSALLAFDSHHDARRMALRLALTNRVSPICAEAIFKIGEAHITNMADALNQSVA